MHAHNWMKSLLLFCIATTLSIVLFVSIHPESLTYIDVRYLGGSFGDGGLYVWLSRQMVDAPWNALRFETNALYPYPITRAWSDSFLLPGALTLLLTTIGISFTIAYNLTLLLAIGLNGGCVAYLGQKIGLRLPYSLFAGVILANSPFMVANLGHPQLIFFFWAPLAWAQVLSPSKKDSYPSKYRWICSGLCVAGAFYCGVYYAIFASIGLGLIWLCYASRMQHPLRIMISRPLCAALGILPVLYSIPSYLAIQRSFGERRLYEAAHFAASGLSYLSYAPLHGLFADSSILSHSEAHLSAGYSLLVAVATFTTITVIRLRSISGALAFLTIATLVLAPIAPKFTSSYPIIISIGGWIALIATAFAMRRANVALSSMILIAVVFFVLSLGPGKSDSGEFIPYSVLTLFYPYIPGLSAIRAIGRMGIIPILVTTLAGSLALQVGWSKLRSIFPKFHYLFSFAVPIIVLIDLLSIKFIPMDSPPSAPSAFQHVKALGQRKATALVIPFSPKSIDELKPEWNRFALINTQYALWANQNPALHLVNGYSGQRSKIQKVLASELANFPDERSFAALGSICEIDTIIVAPRMYKSWNEADFIERLKQYQHHYDSFERFPDGSLAIRVGVLKRVVKPGQTAHIFAPPQRTSELSVSSPAQRCPVTIRSLGLDKRRRTIVLQSSTYRIDSPQVIRTITPTSASQGSPHVIAISTSGCAAEVSCSIPPL